jgi:hypothetical protein
MAHLWRNSPVMPRTSICRIIARIISGFLKRAKPPPELAPLLPVT